jgi:putative acetyltransferase
MKIIIRQEIASDYEKVYEINKLAFNQENESKLIEKNRVSKNYVPELSLIAEIDDKIVGHILFSKIKIVGDSTYDSLA